MIKISKDEMNELLFCIGEDNVEYGLIFRLCYIYGRQISEIYILESKDINFKENKITFNINNSKVEYSLHLSIINDLKAQVNETSTFLFQHIGKDIHNFSNKLNNFLKRYDHMFDVHISPRDFKRLRGQHLILDGVPVELVNKLYHGRNITSTKQFIEYDKLQGIKKVENVDMILSDFTF